MQDAANKGRNGSQRHPEVASANRAKAQAWRRARETCKHGHPWSLENTRIRPNGWRDCRTCGRLKTRKRYAIHSERILARDRELRAANRESYNAYQREWRARKRALAEDQRR